MYPVIAEPFGFTISTFGVMVALGFICAAALTAASFEKAGLERERAWNVLTWTIVGGLVGAKLWNVAESLAREPDASLLALLTNRAGLTWYGGMLGAILFSALGARRNGVPLKAGFDAAAAGAALGQAIGRIGCFLVGDDYGKPTDVAWSVSFPEGQPPTIDPVTGEVFRVHPTMLYESAWLLLAGAWLWRRRGRSPFLFGEYLIAQGLGRLVIEHWRSNPALVGPFTNAQLVALSCLFTGIAGWSYFARRRPRELSPV
jgi:phosphatidylglycerol:prolipoprotein diacylglycerol transferase